MVCTVEVHSGPEPIVREWDALADAAAAPPWLRPGWFAAWWDSYGTGRLEVVAARRAGALVAVAPLRRHRGGLASATNWHSPGFGLLAADPDARAALARALLDGRPRSLALHLLDSHSGDVEACVAAARAGGYSVLTRVEMRSPYVVVEGDLDDQLRARSRGARLRKELRRQRRRAERETGDSPALRLERGQEDLARALQTLLRLEGSGWKDRRRSAIASRADTRAFYERVARWAAERGELRLAFLDIGSRPVAAELLLDDGRAIYDLKGGYDETFRRFGPGKLLAEALLRHAFAGAHASFELLGSDERFKLQWTDLVRERVLFRAFAPSLSGRVEDLVQRRGRPIAKRVLSARRRPRPR